MVGSSLRRIGRGIDLRLFPDTPVPGDHLTRSVMNRAIGSYLDLLEPPALTAVEISGSAQRSRSWKTFETLDFPDFDLCAPLKDRPRYDVVICEQVLEHVPDPWVAVRNLRGLCAPGGHVIVSTPFLIRVHEMPIYAMHDYWRFTPRGLRTLLEGAGLRVERVGSWGNEVAVAGNLHRWTARRPWHPMRNEPDLPIQVWAFATNPLEEAGADLK
jgi:SAM-dependent methyltransferase